MPSNSVSNSAGGGYDDLFKLAAENGSGFLERLNLLVERRQDVERAIAELERKRSENNDLLIAARKEADRIVAEARAKEAEVLKRFSKVRAEIEGLK